jgi:hypothetical protein
MFQAQIAKADSEAIVSTADLASSPELPP